MTALSKHQEPAGQVAHAQDSGDALLAMLERASRDPAVDIEKMRQLVELRKEIRREEKSEHSIMAFNEAFADMQPQLPSIAKRGESNNGSYAKWEDIQAGINPVLHAHGFGLMFKTDTSGDRVKVTAILRHRAGHSESTDFELKPDKSGNKQEVHAVASAVSYAKRYAAGALLNIQTGGEDDDGNSAGKPISLAITDEQVVELRTMIGNTGSDEARFIKFLEVERLDELPADRFAHAMGALRAAAKARENVQ